MKTQNRCCRSHFFEISDGEPRQADQTGTIGFDSKPVLGHVDSLADYRTQTHSLGILLARAGFGVILITREGQFIYANDVAKTLLSSRRGLCCIHDQIVAVDTEANKKLHEIISGNSCRSGVLLKDEDSDGNLRDTCNSDCS